MDWLGAVVTRPTL